MGYGDEVVAAGQAQRIYEADHSMRVMICDQRGQARWHPIWEGNPIIATPADVATGDAFHQVVNGPNCRPYIVYPFTKETGWTFNREFHCRDHVARIYLTATERQRGVDALGRLGPYVLIEPFTKHENFRWPMDRWEALIEACPGVTFVQHTHDDSLPVRGAHPEVATFREACGLAASALAYVRSESGMCHAAAALGVPQVTLFGGCMDADVMGGYPGQECIVDNGHLTPCGSWNRCQHCIDAMAGITVKRVKAALNRILRRSH